tara:strand:- start:3982 stop:4413 length:432 start_codon:yes stop_codon:yes gene_type:complete
MGSSGSGSFTDYPGSQGGRPSSRSGDKSSGSGGSGGAGGAGSGDQCENQIASVRLEEVANCEYYENHQSTPSVGTKVRVRKKLANHRVAVETSVNGEIVGYMPTIFNYLPACMKDGWQYSGKVTQTSSGQNPKVTVDLSASNE